MVEAAAGHRRDARVFIGQVDLVVRPGPLDRRFGRLASRHFPLASAFRRERVTPLEERRSNLSAKGCRDGVAGNALALLPPREAVDSVGIRRLRRSRAGHAGSPILGVGVQRCSPTFALIRVRLGDQLGDDVP
jgi:hypothetical protein